jgi:hypothetical protein
MQWLQDPNHSNVYNLNNVRREASRHFRNNKKEYLKIKIDELKTNSKIKTIRDLYRGNNNFKKGYQPRTNIVKMRRVIWLQTAAEFWLSGASISLSCLMYMGLMMLGRQKYTQQNHQCLSRMPLRLR